MKNFDVPVVIVAAMSRGKRALGCKNQLLWHVPADMKRFKKLTLGHPIIMGRKTFESILDILGKPLPGRTNIVLTSDPEYHHEGVFVAANLEEAFRMAKIEEPTEIHIGGGGEVYRQALPYVSRLHVTYFDNEPEADSFFPEFLEDFKAIAEHPSQEHKGLQYQWVDYVRIDKPLPLPE